MRHIFAQFHAGFMLAALLLSAQASYADMVSRPAWSYTTQNPLDGAVPMPVPRPQFSQHPTPSRGRAPMVPSFMPPSAQTQPRMAVASASVPTPPIKPAALAAPNASTFLQQRTTTYVRPVNYVTMAERMGIPHPRPIITHAPLTAKTMMNYANKAAEDEEEELGYLGEDHRIMHVPSLRKGYAPNSGRTPRFTLMGAKPAWYPFDDHVITSCFPPLLRSALQHLADHFHRDVIVTSGYRDHGRAHSRHRTCEAADIMVDGITPAQLAKAAAQIIGVNGIGTYRHVRITHIDVRDYKAAWRY